MPQRKSSVCVTLVLLGAALAGCRTAACMTY